MAIADDIRIKQDFREDSYVFEKGLEDKPDDSLREFQSGGRINRWAGFETRGIDEIPNIKVPPIKPKTKARFPIIKHKTSRGTAWSADS